MSRSFSEGDIVTLHHEPGTQYKIINSFVSYVLTKHHPSSSSSKSHKKDPLGHDHVITVRGSRIKGIVGESKIEEKPKEIKGGRRLVRTRRRSKRHTGTRRRRA